MVTALSSLSKALTAYYRYSQVIAWLLGAFAGQVLYLYQDILWIEQHHCFFFISEWLIIQNFFPKKQEESA